MYNAFPFSVGGAFPLSARTICFPSWLFFLLLLVFLLSPTFFRESRSEGFHPGTKEKKMCTCPSLAPEERSKEPSGPHFTCDEEGRRTTGPKRKRETSIITKQAAAKTHRGETRMICLLTPLVHSGTSRRLGLSTSVSPNTKKEKGKRKKGQRMKLFELPLRPLLLIPPSPLLTVSGRTFFALLR